MSKILRVISPFFVMELGDTLVLSKDGKTYVSEHNEEFHKADDENSINSTYSSTFNISIDYAKSLIQEGYLEEVDEKSEKQFVNVFDEISRLILEYEDKLNNVDEDMVSQPECLKVESKTVYANIIKVLKHLKDLRK